MRRITIVLLVFVAFVVVLGRIAAPYAHAAGLLVRVSNAGGASVPWPTRVRMR